MAFRHRAAAPSTSPPENRMKFESFRYMAWAKENGQGRFALSLAESGTRSVSADELGIDPGTVALNGVDRYGPPELMTRLAGFLGVSERNVVRASGTSLANFLAYGAVLDRGDEALVETPSYEGLHGLPQLFGAVARPFPRDERFGIDPERVIGLVSPRTRLVVLSNLHNPSGVAASDPALAEIGRAAERNGFHVLVDEVYQDFLGERPLATAFLRLGPRFLATSSLTKVYGLGGLRIGFLVAEDEVARRAEQLMDYLSVVTSYPSSMIACRALDRIAALRERALAIARENFAIVREWASREAGRIEWTPPDAGIIAFLRLRGGKSGDDVAFELLRRHETLVVPGSFFGARDCIRIGFGGKADALRRSLSNLSLVLAARP